MAQFPCLPLWTDALLADTGHLSDAEFGRYMRMLILIWRTPGCRVPNDDAWLTRHLPHTATIEDIRATVSEYCQTDGNFITQKRLKREFVDRFEFGGRMSALAKRRKNKTNGGSSSRSTAEAVPPKPSPSTHKPSFFGESQWTTTSTDHHPEFATQDHPQAKTTTPSPSPTADQPDHSKNTTADNPDPSTSNPPASPHQHPTSSKPHSNASQRPPETLAEINQRMGWSPPHAQLHYPTDLSDDEKRLIAIEPKTWTPAQILALRNQSSGR
jgi:uncharacterized protein YdaU (DUF1376 family)